MANKTVLDFLAVTSTDPADVFYVIRGTGAGRDKKITWANLTANLLDKTSTGASTVSGVVTFTNGSIPLIVVRPTPSVTGMVRGFTVSAQSSGDMLDTFGASMRYVIKDTAGVDNEIAVVGATRDGADNSGKYVIQLANAGVMADRFTVDKTGLVSASDSVALLGQTASRVPYMDANKKLVSSAVNNTELGYLSGVTSALQTQLNGKAPTNHTSSGTAYGAASSTDYGHVQIENAVTDGSMKAVTSNAVFDALETKAPTSFIPLGAGGAHYIKTLASSVTGWFFAGRIAFYKGAGSNEVGVFVIRFARSATVGSEIDSYDRVRVSYSAIAGVVNYAVVGLDGAPGLLNYTGYTSGDEFFIDFTIYCQSNTVAIGQIESLIISNGTPAWVNTNTNVTASAGATQVPTKTNTPADGADSQEIANTAWSQGEFLHKPVGSVEVWNIDTIPVLNPSDADKNKAYGLTATASGDGVLSTGTMSVGNALYVFGNPANLGSSLELGINYANPAGVVKRLAVSRITSSPYESSGVLFIRYGSGWMPVGGYGV